jgi:hypothetical protein
VRGTIDDFTDGCHSGRGTKQSEAKQEHRSSNGIETYTDDFKAENTSSMQSCQLEAEHPLKINSRLVVSLTLPVKRER